MKNLIKGLLAATILMVSSSAMAVIYNYSDTELAAFTLLDPTDGTVSYTGMSGINDFLVIFGSSASTNTAVVGSTGSKDFTGYDSISLILNNSSYDAITAGLFVVDGNGAFIVNNPLTALAVNQTATLSLDIANLVGPAQQWGMVLSTDLNLKGFTLIHGKVAEPATLGLIGLGLLGLGFAKRKKS